jgi:hypothetical protein
MPPRNTPNTRKQDIHGGMIRFRVFGVFCGSKKGDAAQAQVQWPNWVDPYLVVKDTRRILEAVS